MMRAIKINEEEGGLYQVYINGPDHMTKMAAMPIYC